MSDRLINENDIKLMHSNITDEIQAQFPNIVKKYSVTSMRASNASEVVQVRILKYSLKNTLFLHFF